MGMYTSVRLKKWVLAAAAALALGCAAGGLLKGAGAVEAAAPAREGTPLPVIMYHGLLRDEALQGDYVISPEILESDMAYLQEQGYTALHIQDLLDYVDGKAGLPEKPVLLTFDDGYYNNYLYAYPLAQKYQMKLVVAPIGYYTDQYSETKDEHAPYSHITWDQMAEMQESGLVEFQNHTYNLHGSGGQRLGTKKLAGESSEAYAALLSEDLMRMQKKMEDHLGRAPSCFVYPFGAVSETEPEIIRSLGFRCTLTCESRINYITRDAECLYGLGRWRRPPGTPSGEFFQEILGGA